MRVVFALCLLCITLFTACISTKPYYNSTVENWYNKQPDSLAKIRYSVFLVGDAGMPKYGQRDSFKSYFRNVLSETDTNAAIIFMGDNIYPAGMPPEGHKNRAEAENSIASQLEILQNYKGKTFFIPGNHDWNQSRKGGLEYIKREAAYLETSAQNEITFLPDSGCPGPVEIHLRNDLVLLLIDTEWWLHKHEKPYGVNSPCTAKNEDDFIKKLKLSLEKNKSRNVILAAHHPLYSNGTHGGYFPLRDHIFPLAALKKNFYIPLPILGSIYIAYRKYIGHRQDIPNRKYNAYKVSLENALALYKNVVIAAGHDHNLQYFHQQNNHFIVSGSGSKSYYVKRGCNAQYAQNTKGFARLNYYEAGKVWLEYWGLNTNTQSMELQFRMQLL